MRRLLVVAVVVALAGYAVFFWHQRRHAPAEPPHPAHATTAAARPQTFRSSPRLAALAATLPADAVSPIARDLDAATGNIHHDLEILNAVFEAWRTNFPTAGNPVGENDEITAALAGDNSLHFAFISPSHPAIDAAGQICDRWGTPFRFHQLSGTVMELWSAGPDRRFGDADDVKLTPLGKAP